MSAAEDSLFCAIEMNALLLLLHVVRGSLMLNRESLSRDHSPTTTSPGNSVMYTTLWKYWDGFDFFGSRETAELRSGKN